jgi:DnaJ-class molecular chaperone
MGDEVPSRALSKEQVIRRVTEIGSNRQAVVDAADCSVEQEYTGEKVQSVFVIRSVSRTTEFVTTSAEYSVTTANEIDGGKPDGVLDTYGGNSTKQTPAEVASYSGITREQQVECPDCSGNGRSCNDCSGTGTQSCSCAGGTVKHRCGCRSKEENRGKGITVRAYKGEVLKTCQSCGGDGRLGDTRSSCTTCDGRGAFAETCKNCGGDGVSSREQCKQCDGKGDVVCQKCDGMGNVDECETCDGSGEVIKQEVTDVVYTVTRKQEVEGHRFISNNPQALQWRQSQQEIVTDSFEELSTDPDMDAVAGEGEEEIDIVVAQVTTFESPVYKATVTLRHPTLEDTTASVNALVSNNSLIERDGTFSTSDQGGIVSRFVIGAPLALGTSVIGSLGVGLFVAFPISFIFAIFSDFGILPLPTSFVPHPFAGEHGDISALLIGMTAVVSVIIFLLGTPDVIREMTSKYEFTLEEEDETNYLD